MPGVLAVYHAAGDDLGLGPVPVLSDAARRPSTGRCSPPIGSASSATSWRPSWPRRARKPSMPPRPSSSTSTRCRRWSSQADALAPDAAAALPRGGQQRLLRHRLRRGRGSAGGRRRRRRGGDGEPAPGRRADGAQRLPHGAGRAAGRHHLLDLAPGPALGAARSGRRARPGARVWCGWCARGWAAASARRPRSTWSTWPRRPRPCNWAGRSSGWRPARRTWWPWCRGATSP